LVAVRGPIIGGTCRVRPGVVTAAAGDIITAKVGHGGEVYVGLPKWVRPGGTVSYADQVIADGASHYWRLNEASGAAVTDSVGTLHGTVFGTVTRGATGPHGDPATDFTGAGRIDLPALSIPAVCAVEVWFKSPSAKSFNQTLTNRTSAQSTNHMLMVQDGKVVFACNGASRSGSQAINNGAWHHLVGVSDGASVGLFIDGVSEGSAVPGVFAATAAVGKIGGDDFAGNSVLTLGDVAIYPRAMTAEEIAAHYALRTAVVSAEQPSALAGTPVGWVRS
jgi:hypothetical protein